MANPRERQVGYHCNPTLSNGKHACSILLAQHQKGGYSSYPSYLPFILNTSIATLTALDFLGFGLPPDAPSFGRLLSDAKANLHAPWIGVFAFTTLAIMLILLIFVGEAVRDALDPRRSFSSRE